MLRSGSERSDASVNDMSADDVSVNTVDSETKHFAEVVGESDRVAVEGGRTRWSAGGALEEGGRLVRAPSGVIEYRPEEMIVRLRAGTTVRDLDQALREGGQRSALPDRGGTVGGALAVGENHLEALGRGTVR